MLNTAIVGLGWWGKNLVKAARDIGAPMKFVRGVTLEPDSVRDFAAEHQIQIGTSFAEVLADRNVQAVLLATPHSAHRAQRSGGGGRQAHLLRKALRVEQGRCRSYARGLCARRYRHRRRPSFPLDAVAARHG